MLAVSNFFTNFLGIWRKPYLYHVEYSVFTDEGTPPIYKEVANDIRDEIFNLLIEDGLNSGETLFYIRSNKNIPSLIECLYDKFINFRKVIIENEEKYQSLRSIPYDTICQFSLDICQVSLMQSPSRLYNGEFSTWPLQNIH